MNNIGVMQGRLSDKPNLALQSFPWDSWQKEFERANSIGFNQIEWLVDGYNDNDNPTASLEGQKEILELSDKFSVSVNSLCAHSLIDGNLLHADPLIVENAKHKFSQILSWASAINIEFVIFPIMDAMSIQSDYAKEKLKNILHEVVDIDHPKILLESDLTAFQLNFFLDDVDMDNLGILYDLGNATAMGFDIENELRVLHADIGEVHIKDRYINNGGSVRLGNADTRFEAAVRILNDLSWQGSFVLETPILGDWQTEAYSNFNFTANLLN